MDVQFDRVSAEAAQARGDWATAIAMVGGFAECYSRDHQRHNAHLWHMELLVKAGLLPELAELSETDVHARRQLNWYLYEGGRGVELRERAQRGDKTALYLLVRLLRSRGEYAAAEEAAAEIDPTYTYAIELTLRSETAGSRSETS